MCGIVAVLARRPSRKPPSASEVGRSLSLALASLSSLDTSDGPGSQLELLLGAEVQLSSLGTSLKGVAGLACLLGSPATMLSLERCAAQVERLVSGYEAALDAGGTAMSTEQLERVNAALVSLHDATWALGHDRVEAARSVDQLSRSLSLGREGEPPGVAALGALWAVHVALRSLDRLEVRGRDSAGLNLMLSGLDHGLPGFAPLLAGRESDPLFTSLAVRRAEGCLSVVYKTAAEIGELGDNVAALRRALASDPLLALALASPDVEATVLGHTRWASVGLISEANAHPLDSDGEGGTECAGAYVVGALNGDIDNYTALVASEGIGFPAGVTTDAKLVPALVSRYAVAGDSPGEAFRKAVNRFEGSVGIAANAAAAPDELLLALRGSGQSLNVGLAEDAFVVASEPYGLVEETSRYVRMDGEQGGQLVACGRALAGDLAGLSRWRYDGKELVLSEADVHRAEITTRDVDRRGFKHFLLKEISESPASVRKTLRGKLVEQEKGGFVVRLGDVLPRQLRDDLAAGRVHQVLVIGQGTAAVAGQAVAGAISRSLPEAQVWAMPASELSGWGPAGLGLPDDMAGDLVIAVSQSGTTTDTNRTVDLVRARGAHVVCIVNRRNSDLVQKSHGVLYTSDGRDVEMSVASTKAFYSQVTAGYLLAAALADAAGRPSREDVLMTLRELPSLLERVLALRPQVAQVAASVAPARRSWAVVGSGPDRVAAAEVRIKLSELCYKAIALDTIEDKKHIDLSAEPMVFVCAPGIKGPNAADVVKEVEIFRAHKAAPVVVTSEGQADLFGAGVDVLAVPECHPELAFVLAAMVGHLFGYEAALAIDALATPLREARALLQAALVGPHLDSPHLDSPHLDSPGLDSPGLDSPGLDSPGLDSPGLDSPGLDSTALDGLAPLIEAGVSDALASLRAGGYDGSLNASTATRLNSLLRYETGSLPVEGYEAEMGKVGTPVAMAGDLLGALSAAIDELTRPVDAIKHQAKTVTVGISRSEDALVRSMLVSEVLAAGAAVGSLGYRALRALAALSPAVEEVLGYTRYQIEGATITVTDRGGISRGIISRTASDNTLRGTKHRAAERREITVFKGLQDGRTGVMVPEVKDGQVTGLTLLHARFAERLPHGTAATVLRAYQGRYQALVDAVTETRPDFDDVVLGEVPVIELLTEPVALLAGHWAP